MVPRVFAQICSCDSHQASALQGSVQLFHRDVPLSIQEAYETLLCQEAMSLSHYQVCGDLQLLQEDEGRQSSSSSGWKQGRMIWEGRGGKSSSVVPTHLLPDVQFLFPHLCFGS